VGNKYSVNVIIMIRYGGLGLVVYTCNPGYFGCGDIAV
jgi:hypothetical protein